MKNNLSNTAAPHGDEPVACADCVAWDAAIARYQHSYAAAVANAWEDDDLASKQGNDWVDLMYMPAPHIAALHWKLGHLYGTPNKDGSTIQWDYDLVSFVVEDARRLAGVEA